MTTDAPSSDDLLGVVADLIGDVGTRTRNARRYRALASTFADPLFERVLTLGSEFRRIARGDHWKSAIGNVITELEGLRERCDRAVAEVRGSHHYQAAAASFRTGEVLRVATLAPGIFTDVVEWKPRAAVYWPVSLTTTARRGPHFIPATECAARIRAVASEGIASPETPPDIGGDDAIRPVVLSDEHDGSESPIAVAFEPDGIPGPLCRVEGGGTVLFYSPHLRATPRVVCQRTVDDEWWRIRPESYRRYLDDLQQALEVDGLGTILTIA